MQKVLQTVLAHLPEWLGGRQPEQPLTIDGNGLSTIEVHTDKVGRMVGLSVTFHDKAQSQLIEDIYHQKEHPSEYGEFQFSKKHPKQATIRWTEERVPPQAFDDAIFAFLDILVDQGHITPAAIENALQEYYPHVGKTHHMCGAALLDTIDIMVSNPSSDSFAKPILLEVSLNPSMNRRGGLADAANTVAHAITAILYEHLEKAGSLASPSTPDVDPKGSVKIALNSLSDAEHVLEGLQKRDWMGQGDVEECLQKMASLQPTKHITMPAELHSYLEKQMAR